MKTTPRQSAPLVARRSVVDRRGIAALMSILLLALLISKRSGVYEANLFEFGM